MDQGAISVAITHQQLALKLITSRLTPAAVEALSEHIAIDIPNRPVELIIRQAKITKDFAKAAKQLEAISRAIICLGPGVALSDDEIARDPQRSPSPQAMLKLQTTALRIRRLWWKLAKHQPDISHELLEPFFKCASAFVRRAKHEDTEEKSSTLLTSCVESLGSFDPTVCGNALFPIHRILCAQAQREKSYQEASQWAERMTEDCTSLDLNHARRAVGLVQKAALLYKDYTEDNTQTWTNVASILQSKIIGSSADCDILIEAMNSLSRAVFEDRTQISLLPTMVKVLALSATFCQRYARSYPGRNTEQVITILNAALRYSQSMDELLTWLSGDSAKIFIEVGALKEVAKVAAMKPLLEAWSSSRVALSLSRIVNVLLLKAVRSTPDQSVAALFDDETLEAAGRGILLEWQLQWAADLAPRVKYHEALKKLLPELLRRLAKIYIAAEYPIRRARVVTIAFRIREGHPDLILPHVFKVWHDGFKINNAELGQDAGLVGYLDDVMARLAISRLFAEMQPTVDDLKPHLRVWQRAISSCSNYQDVCDHVDDSSRLFQQLSSIATYLSMLGDDQAALPVGNLLLKLNQLCGEHIPDTCSSLMSLAQTYLDLGYPEGVHMLLSQLQVMDQQRQVSQLSLLERKVVNADYMFAIDKFEDCSAAITEAKNVASEFSLGAIPREHRRAFEIAHAKAWLLRSKLQLAQGGSKESLRAAKRTVQILNSIWCSVERSAGIQESTVNMEPTAEGEIAVNGLVKGISKLQLTLTEEQKVKDSEQQNRKGASFWPVVPILLKALLHLSDVYAHHGLFNESDYYSQRAVHMAESVGSTLLLSRVRSHRCRLLTLAGRRQEAELCLNQDIDTDFDSVSVNSVERCCAKAEIRVREGALPEALELYQKAERMLEMMNSEEFRARLESFGGFDGDSEKKLAALSIEVEPLGGSVPQTTRKTVERPAKKPSSKQQSGVGLHASSKVSKPDTSVNTKLTSHVLQKITARICMEIAMINLRLGKERDEALGFIDQYQSLAPDSFRGQLLRHQSFIGKATQMLELNVTLSLLTESTLSVPALAVERECHPEEKRRTIAITGSKKITKATGKTTKKPIVPHDSPQALLGAARNCLSEDLAARLHLCSTSQIHSGYSSLSGVSFLLSAIVDFQAAQAITPEGEAMGIDLPRIKALQYEKGSIAVDVAQKDDPRHLAWPETMQPPKSRAVSGPEFQSSFVDILPKPWTTVSLCLSEDGSELLLARYRSGVIPFVLKLPFSRHKPGEDDGPDEPAFDYRKGKAELQEIIELSNYTCHNPGSLDARGAKTKWWKEREDLDRRLHELLINIESIWFGGFKAIFSLLRSDSDAISRFRMSFEQILARHLPSRKAAKGTPQHLVLDDQILELFVGLGSDCDGALDLEEPLTDLLYFVVDLLQFKGERNAYDEIDFDSMVVDVLDELRAYHEMIARERRSSEHLILVLDRRLQAFPWESLPCLEGSSVSRVGSLLSLRDCVLSMKGPSQASCAAGLPDESEGCHVVCRHSGTYILNPSSDLAPTQAMLEPALSTLTRSHGSRWTSVVNEVPSEDYFRSALNDSSIVLYFGHGAGSQYIRPRTIKRLERCSEVVWLMGCSSGAIWEYGDLEPCAVPLAYLLAGSKESAVDAEAQNVERSSKCMSVVATLWDVTDKDIDRFSLAVGEEWGLWPASRDSKIPTKTPKKRVVVAQPSTPVQIPKTPKTPKLQKTPAIARTPATNRKKLNRADGKKMSLVEAVAQSRDACYLRYLNGAAPVVYGIPVYLGE
jgi:separase